MTESLEFTYTDAKGETSTRCLNNITRFTLPDNPYTYLRGWDSTCNATRLFRQDRIIEVKQNELAWLATTPLKTDITAEAFKPRTPKKSGPEICFTGFSRNDVRPQLEALAIKSGLLVRKSVTKKLAYLVMGYNAGAIKIEKAKQQQVDLFTEEEFINFLETGEIPPQPHKS